ncbi:hypothetical protein OA07_25060 [Aphanizomenon flos-aquae 2012/KM1/D3]|nr:hypothetical protein OA07_25060 [Aphanizomenon flos-aquae 2012/KM1/D3]
MGNSSLARIVFISSPPYRVGERLLLFKLKVIFNYEVRSPIAIMVQHDNNIESNDSINNWELIQNNYIYSNLSPQQELQIKHLLLEELPNK